MPFVLYGFFLAGKNQIIDDEWVFTEFESSPRMSTYLFAFTVSEFTSTVSPINSKIEVSSHEICLQNHSKCVTLKCISLIKLVFVLKSYRKHENVFYISR